MISADNTMSVHSLLKNSWIKGLIILLPCLFFLVLLIIFSGNYLILSGEGNYFTNFQLTRDIGSFSWGPTLQGVGFPNPTLNGLVGIFDFFSLLQKLGASLKMVNTLLAFLVYALPFLTMMWMLHKALRANLVISYVLSLFYVLNPFSTSHLQGLMFWNTAPLFVLPLIFGLIYKYYYDKLRLFLFFGLLTAILSFSFSNIPYLGVFHIFLFMSIIVVPYIRNVKFDLRIFLRNLFLTELSFLLFNSWWFMNLLRFQMQDVSNYYTKSFAVDWATYAIGDGGIMGKIFLLKTLISVGKDNFFSIFYNSMPMNIILFIPFFIIIWFLSTEISDPRSKGNGKGNLIVILFVLLTLFLNKGVNEPLSGIYLWMLNNIPFFIIFKSPLEKFSILLVFLLTLSIVLIFRNVKKKWSYCLMIVYVIAGAIPYFTLNFMPEYKMENFKYVSKKYLHKKGVFLAKQSLNKSKLDYRCLSLPGSLNYQVTLLNHDGNKYYRGMDAFVYSINKPFITAYSSSDPFSNLNALYNNFSNSPIEDMLLNLYNIKKIVIDKDIYPSFGFREKENIGQLTDIFEESNKKQDFASINIFSRNDFLPHLYIPNQVVISDEEVANLGKISSQSGVLTRPAFYFSKQNKNNNLDLLKKTVSDTPTLEFMKINPTKYRIVVHGAKGEFPLVFSESFHEGWKVYLANPNTSLKFKVQNSKLSEYKILDGNAEDQASRDELKSFIDKGWITTFGSGKEKEIKHQKWDSSANIWQGNEVFDYSEKYTIDFISKNFQSTIQNDNLPSGQFYETWLNKPIDDNRNHLMVNGYANSWMIDTNKICNSSLDSRLRGNDKKTGNESSMCIKNADRSYDFEVIIEFWPQRLYYIGLAISGTTLLGCLSYLTWAWVIRRKGNEKEETEEIIIKRLRT